MFQVPTSSMAFFSKVLNAIWNKPCRLLVRCIEVGSKRFQKCENIDFLHPFKWNKNALSWLEGVE